MNLSSRTKLTKALVYASAADTREGAILDMQGYDGVLVICACATIAGSAAGDIHMEQDTDDAFGDDPQDLAGTKLAIVDGDSNKVFVIDLYRPLDRYVRAVVTKNGAQAQAETVLYIQYQGAKCPVANMGADGYELHVSPAEGTK